MLFEFNRFSSLLLIFFVHGLVYALLLFRKSAVHESRADRWLGIFLVLCILYIFPWMTGFAGWYDTQPYRDWLFYIPFQHLYFIGPVIFFYVQSLLNPSFRLTKKNGLHLLPGVLYVVYSLVVFMTDQVFLKRYYFLSDGTDRDFDTWYQLSGMASMLFYFILSLRYHALYRKLMVQVISYADILTFRWVRNFLLAFLLMLLVRAGFFVSSLFIPFDYWLSWWYFFVFAIIFYYIAITGYANSTITTIGFTPNLLTYRPALLLNYQPHAIDDRMAAEEAEIIDIETLSQQVSTADPSVMEWKEKIMQFMITTKAYEDPELSLAQLARQLDSNVSLISKTINQGFGLNFNDFVNQYRIDAVKQLIDKGEHKRQTLLAIAFEAGFNSKATFNRAFKKATGKSPRQFIADL